MRVAQSCLTLIVHGILQARILEYVAIPFSRGLSQSRDWTHVSWIASRFFTGWATRKLKNIGVGSLSLFSRGSSQPRKWTRVSWMAGRFFTSWATRKNIASMSETLPVLEMCIKDNTLFYLSFLLQGTFISPAFVFLMLVTRGTHRRLEKIKGDLQGQCISICGQIEHYFSRKP